MSLRIRTLRSTLSNPNLDKQFINHLDLINTIVRGIIYEQLKKVLPGVLSVIDRPLKLFSYH